MLVWTVRWSRMKSLNLIQEAKRNQQQGVSNQEGKLIETGRIDWSGE